MNIPDGLPILSRGSHDRASGKACIMNAISYLKGNINITDAPDCVASIIRYAFITVNDRICFPGAESLCPQCSHLLWLKGIGTIGTAEGWATLNEGQKQVLSYRLIHSTVICNPYLPTSGKNDIMSDVGKLIVEGHNPVGVVETAIDQVTSRLLLKNDVSHFEMVDRGAWVLETVMQVFESFTHKIEPVELTPDQFVLVANEAKVPVHTNAH